jgi:serine/threonine protein kinase
MYLIKIIDFGAACRIESKSATYFTRYNGTLDYAAPEHLMGQIHKGAAGDMWYVGID